MLFVESSDLMLLLLIDVVALFDLNLVSDDQIFFIILLGYCLVFLLFEELYLWLCVELIDFNTSNLIQNILQLYFLLFNIFSDLASLLQ